MDPYDVIIMPWITEKTLEARRIADPEGGHRENNNRIEFIVRRGGTALEGKENKFKNKYLSLKELGYGEEIISAKEKMVGNSWELWGN